MERRARMRPRPGPGLPPAASWLGALPGPLGLPPAPCGRLPWGLLCRWVLTLLVALHLCRGSQPVRLRAIQLSGTPVRPGSMVQIE